MRWRILLGSLGCALLVARQATAGPALTKGPYLQHLSASSSDIRVELSTAAPATLELELPDRTKRTQGDAASTFHSFHVTGLSPATHYRYTVRVGRDAVGSGELTTAPSDDSTAPVSFLLYGDNRSDQETHAAVIRAIEREPFDFLVHTGDFVVQGGVDEYWQQFFDVERTLLRDHCLFACIGNHELFEDNTAAHYERFFGAATETDGPPYGTFRWGPVRFFLLNAFEGWSGRERAWLEDSLAAADSEPGLAWRIAVVHHSPWAAGPHGDNKRMLQAHVDDLLVRHHVDLVLAGHDHIYERGSAKGLKYVISGGAGAPLYTELSPEPSTRKVEASYHYVLFSLTRDHLVETAKRVDGSLIEKCGFVHGSDWDCDAKSAPTPPPSVVPEQPAATHGRCGCSAPGHATGSKWGASVLLALVIALVRRRGHHPGAASPVPWCPECMSRMAQEEIAMDENVYPPPSKELSQKQLIPVAVAHVTQCPYCIRGHTKVALRHGASEKEIMEAIWVAAEMRAGAAFAHSTVALETMTRSHGA